MEVHVSHLEVAEQTRALSCHPPGDQSASFNMPFIVLLVLNPMITLGVRPWERSAIGIRLCWAIVDILLWMGIVPCCQQGPRSLVCYSEPCST
jgi:uncharacterized membrane protein YhaH (DUF805 family)